MIVLVKIKALRIVRNFFQILLCIYFVIFPFLSSYIPFQQWFRSNFKRNKNIIHSPAVFLLRHNIFYLIFLGKSKKKKKIFFLVVLNSLKPPCWIVHSVLLSIKYWKFILNHKIKWFLINNIKCEFLFAMQITWFCLLGLIYCAGSVSSSGEVFTSSFLVRFKRNVNSEMAHQIASKYGFENIGTVSKIIN